MFQKSKWLLSFVLTAALLFGLSGGAAAQAAIEPTSKHITILHTNDMHARAVESSSGEMGFAKVAGIIDRYRSEHPNTLVIDAGDAFHGTTFATLVDGVSIVQVMNLMGYNAMAPGNHEFNYGTDRLLELSNQLVFPMLSANVRDAEGERLFEAYTIEEIDGVKIGLFGLTTPETAYKTHPKNVEHITFTDPVQEAQLIVDELHNKVDVIIAIGHLGQDESSIDTSFKVIEAVDGIDIFIDGHSHTVLQEGLMTAQGTLIASAGEYTNYVGVIDLWVDNGAVVKKEVKLINQEAAVDITPNAEVAELVASILSSQEAILAEKVSESNVLLEGAREKVRVGETNLGNLLTDALLYVTDADIALTNGGGIRSSIAAGDITKGDVITVLPFGNQIVTLEVTGADIKAALEVGTSDYPNPKGAFPHVAGMSFKIDPAAKIGDRIHSILVDGKELDEKATYLLATNDFVAAGGDEYTMFGVYPQAGMYGSLDEALIAYMQTLDIANAAIEGRITEGTKPGAAPQPLPNSETKPEVKPEPAPAVYIVKKGDTLYAIARKHGTTWQVLRDINKLNNPHLIHPGQKIILPH